MVMTFENDLWTPFGMRAVCAHEIGHLFWALDEYPGASSNIEEAGYLNIVNGNHILGGVTNDSCIMRGGSDVGAFWANAICGFTRTQVGWRDLDGDAKEDITDRFPIVTLTPFVPDPTTSPGVTFNGVADVDRHPNNNKAPWNFGNDIQVDTIKLVEFSVDGGPFTLAMPSDGFFNFGQEFFTFTAGPFIPPSTHTFCVRATQTTSCLGLFNVTTTLSCDSVTFLRPPTFVAVEDWPQFHHDFAHTGTTADQLCSFLDLKWSQTLSARGVANFSFSSPSVMGGTVFVGALDGQLLAFNALSGAPLWSFAVGPPSVEHAPAVVQFLTGTVVVIGTSTGLAGIDGANGSLLWTVTLNEVRIIE